MVNNTANTKLKKKKKNVEVAVVHALITFNNTIVTFADTRGNVIAFASGGMMKFTGAKKATPYAAELIVKNASEKAKEHNVKTVSIRISGPGHQRESVIRAIFAQNFVVTAVLDVTPIAHNGVRAPKRRRV